MSGELIAMHAGEFSNLFYTESYLETIVSFTNIYALQRGFTLNTNIEEMKFFGILIITVCQTTIIGQLHQTSVVTR